MPGFSRSYSRRCVCLRSVGALALGLVGFALLTPSTSQAVSGPKPRISVEPRNPVSTDVLTLKWRPDRSWRAGYTYVLLVHTPGLPPRQCQSFFDSEIRQLWKRGQTVELTAKSYRSGEAIYTERGAERIGGSPVWCPGKAIARVLAYPWVGGELGGGVVIATKRFVIKADPRSPVRAPERTRAQFAIRDGSSMTVRVAGRPDRVSPVSGLLSGLLQVAPPTGYQPKYVVDLTAASINVTALALDPQCAPNGRPPNAMRLAPTGSTMVASRVTLQLAEDPVAFTGCQGASASENRTLVLDGTTGSDRVTHFVGSLGGMRLTDGAEATITFDLVITPAQAGT